MKKLVLVLTALLLTFSAACAEYKLKYLPLDAINIGDSLIHVKATLKRTDVLYEEFYDEETDLTFLGTYLNVWGFECNSATLCFSPDEKLFYINASPKDGTFNSVYTVFTEHLGAAKKLSLPYVDYDTDSESYIEYIFPIELFWDIEDIGFEVYMEASVYTEIESSFLNGTEIIEDNQHQEDFDFYIYNKALYDKYL